MRKLFQITILPFLLSGCDEGNALRMGCDMSKFNEENANNITITHGIWGTVSSMEGNCMPGGSNSCSQCPVQRTIKIYEYALERNATKSGNSSSFYDSFNTPLVAETSTDENGFFQIDIPDGHYSIAIVENGKLYASGLDGQGGLNPVNLTGQVENVDLIMTYKAVF